MHGGGFGGGGYGFGGNRAYTIRDPAELEMVENMAKALNPAFINDVYTFSRLKYDYENGGRGRFWDDDSPDADLNLEFRLFQATSLKIASRATITSTSTRSSWRNIPLYIWRSRRGWLCRTTMSKRCTTT